MVSRRSLASDLDRRGVHGAIVHWGVRADHDVCWRSDRSFVEFVVSVYEWNGSTSSQLVSCDVK